MMNRYYLAIAAATGLLTACAATTTPQADARFGESVTLLRAQQVIHPEASADTDPVAGIDGKAAKGAMDNYRDSFRKPPPEATPTIGGGSVK
jgi:hypothetical protein